MALSVEEYLVNLINNSTDYYTVKYSVDTDLYTLFTMMSRELASGSSAIDIVRDNVYIPTCESSALFNNFGTFFATPKAIDQQNFEDKYIQWASGSVSVSAPAVYQDILTQEDSAIWTSLQSVPYSFGRIVSEGVIDIPSGYVNESVYWSGSLWGSCFIPKDFADYNYFSTQNIIRFDIDSSSWSLYGFNHVVNTLADYNGYLDWTRPFALCTPRKYLGDGLYSDPEFSFAEIFTFTYPIGTSRTNSPRDVFWPLLYWTRNSLHKIIDENDFPANISGTSFMQLTPPDGYTAVDDFDPGGPFISYTKQVQLHNRHYFAVACNEYPSLAINTLRQEWNTAKLLEINWWDRDLPENALYSMLPQYSKDTIRPYPFLFEYDADTSIVREVGLASIISSGSANGAPISHDSWIEGTPHYGWSVNSICTYEDQVYLDYSSGSFFNDDISVSGDRRHYLASYGGNTWSGSAYGNTARLTAPSGSVKDLTQFNDDFYALVHSGANRYYVAKSTRGLTNVATTEGNWKFNQDLSDDSGNSHTLTGTNIVSSTYIQGMSEAGKTAIWLPDNTYLQNVSLPTASATDFNMGTSDFTIEVVVRVGASYPARTDIINKLVSSGEGYSISLYGAVEFSRIDYGIVRAQVGDSSGQTVMESVTNIADDKWHYIALVIDRVADTLKLYIDGVLQGTNAIAFITGAISPTADLEIGFSTDSNQLQGGIDQVVISKETFSDTEIASRNEYIWNRDMLWTDMYSITVPLKSFFKDSNQLLVTCGDGLVRKWNDTTNVLTIHTASPPNISNLGYSSILSNPSGEFYGLHKDHYDYTPTLFTDTAYRYVYPPAILTASGSFNASIPSYKNQLDFLMDSAMTGATKEGAKNVVKAYTLINPDVIELSTLPGWKLSTYSGSSLQLGPTSWSIMDSQIRFNSRLDKSSKWAGALLTGFSGSVAQGKLVANHLIMDNTVESVFTTLPLQDIRLQWDLRRLTE